MFWFHYTGDTTLTYAETSAGRTRSHSTITLPSPAINFEAYIFRGEALPFPRSRSVSPARLPSRVSLGLSQAPSPLLWNNHGIIIRRRHSLISRISSSRKLAAIHSCINRGSLADRKFYPSASPRITETLELLRSLSWLMVVYRQDWEISGPRSFDSWYRGRAWKV